MDTIVTKNLRFRFLDPVEKCLPVVKADRAAKRTCRFVIGRSWVRLPSLAPKGKLFIGNDIRCGYPDVSFGLRGLSEPFLSHSSGSGIRFGQHFGVHFSGAIIPAGSCDVRKVKTLNQRVAGSTPELPGSVCKLDSLSM
jgi:hypothetical protein